MATSTNNLWRKVTTKQTTKKSNNTMDIEANTNPVPLYSSSTSTSSTSHTSEKQLNHQLNAEENVNERVQSYYESLYNNLHITQETENHIKKIATLAKRINDSNIPLLLINAVNTLENICSLLNKKDEELKTQKSQKENLTNTNKTTNSSPQNKTTLETISEQIESDDLLKILDQNPMEQGKENTVTNTNNDEDILASLFDDMLEEQEKEEEEEENKNRKSKSKEKKPKSNPKNPQNNNKSQNNTQSNMEVEESDTRNITGIFNKNITNNTQNTPNRQQKDATQFSRKTIIVDDIIKHPSKEKHIIPQTESQLFQKLLFKIKNLKQTFHQLKKISHLIKQVATKTSSTLTPKVNLGASILNDLLSTNISTVHFFSGDARKFDTSSHLTIQSLPLATVQWTNIIKNKNKNFPPIEDTIPYQSISSLHPHTLLEKSIVEDEDSDFTDLVQHLDDLEG